MVEVWKTKKEDEREDFRSILQAFIRLYGFVSQLITYEDVELEQLYIFGRSLNRKLPRRRNPLPTEVMDAVDLDSFRVEQTFAGDISLRKEDGKTKLVRSRETAIKWFCDPRARDMLDFVWREAKSTAAYRQKHVATTVKNS